jgi:phospholipase/carboxylesterase
MTEKKLQMLTATVGPLVCRIVDMASDAEAAKRPAPDLLCVLCHGYGAPGTDLVSLAPEVMNTSPSLFGRVRFVFPEAPLSLDFVPFGGRAWWHIDVNRFQRAAMTGDIEPLMAEVPEGLAAARKQLLSAVDELCRSAGVPMSRVVLGGFSQGAMITTDVALRLEEAPAALAILSGTLICKDEWVRLAPRRKGLKVLQSHGMQDPILPYAAAIQLKKLLGDAGLDVELVSFHGGHGIDGDVVVALAKLLEGALGRSA